MIEAGMIAIVLVAIISKYVNSGPAGATPIFVEVE